MRFKLILTLTVCLMLLSTATAQTPATPPTPDGSSSSSQARTPLPDAPTAVPVLPAQTTPYRTNPGASYYYNVGAFCGIGASTSPAATKPTGGCGAGVTFYPLPLFVEVGVMAPQANRSYLTGYISVDGSIPLAKPSTKYLPMAIVGYSRLFETGHSFDYGLALALPRLTKIQDDSRSLRIELRDYWTFANPTQHNVMIRVGWMAAEDID